MEVVLVLLFFFFLASSCLSAPLIKVNTNSIFDVLDYGAKGNGQTDDSQAFLKAWKDACGAMETSTLLIPDGKTFFLQPLSFQGPCKPASINVVLEGKIIAPHYVSAWKWSDTDKNTWIGFSYVKGLIVKGGGQFDGQGAPWWNYNPQGKYPRPTIIHFNNCQNLQLSFLTCINSPKNHISISSCNGVQISHLNIFAPENSPNTDGIDISRSSDIVISDSTMKTGDDCVAINGGSSFINITSLQCGPGHGISVGSLGINGAFDTVEEVHVRNCTFIQSQNGARIKTWEGGSGYARKITFEDIILVAAKSPIIIDQHYNPRLSSIAKKAVEVSDVTFRNMQGTSASQIAINLNCDKNVRCTNITLDHITVTSSIPGKNTIASCANADVRIFSTYPVVTCQ